jgi:preprotein translocase subunit SecG
MTGNLAQDWPVYVLLGAVAFFFIYIIVKGNLQDRKNKEVKKKEQNQNE